MRAAVFRCARQERVSLPGVARVGTATSALLSIFYTVFGPAGNVKLAERAPPRIDVPAVPVVWSRVGQPDAAFGAEPGAIFPAQRRKRQREHYRVAEGWLQVKTVAVEEALLAVVLVLTRIRQVTVQLLEADLER
jgi:hypothetical protein